MLTVTVLEGLWPPIALNSTKPAPNQGIAMISTARSTPMPQRFVLTLTVIVMADDPEDDIPDTALYVMYLDNDQDSFGDLTTEIIAHLRVTQTTTKTVTTAMQVSTQCHRSLRRARQRL